jgi:hypothetical protein
MIINIIRNIYRSGGPDPDRLPKWPEGEEGIRARGHREGVGGLWEQVGALQFGFLVWQGLLPDKVLLDVGCGSFRGGRHFIRWLDPGNYLGLEKQRELVEAGIEKELGPDLVEAKRPEIVISQSFEFHKFTRQPDFALAVSLFTHLTPDDITDCLKGLRTISHTGTAFWATFWEGSSRGNPLESHTDASFSYTRREMTQFASGLGWRPVYFGDWGHPRYQRIMKYEAV